jgi:hypothetical protein
MASKGMVIMQYKPYVPQNAGEILECLGHMMLAAPTFKDKTGYFPRKNIDTTFYSLNEGLLIVREQLGDELYAKLKSMSDRMRALFEADPDDKTGDTQVGRVLIQEMDDLLTEFAKRKATRRKKD